MAKRMKDRGLVGGYAEGWDVYGRCLELEPTKHGRLLAEAWAVQGIGPEGPPKVWPAIGMRALVLLRPWAACVAAGRKVWENRNPKTATYAVRSLVGHRIAIVEGHGEDEAAAANPLAPDGLPWPEPVAPKCVVLTAEVKRVVGPHEELKDPFRVEGECGIELGDKFLLPAPVMCRPMQGWMDLSKSQPGIARAVRDQEKKR